MNEKEIEVFLQYLASQQTAQDYLFHCYQQIGESDPEGKSYQNCNPFMYYLDHGKRFFENGKKVDLFLQPILFFYGMVHLLKACLLTKRPNYPESTSMLAHGVSTRKRKKRHYRFMEDEVKVQHNGLFPYFSQHLFAVQRTPFEKISMDQLLALIPELSLLFHMHGEKNLLEIGMAGDRVIRFPIEVLDQYHLTAKSFLNRMAPHLPEIVETNIDRTMITIRLVKPITGSNGPLFLDLDKGSIHFPASRERFLAIPEVMIHYLLLYNLSMLCRYEAEWWGELLTTKPEIDYPFIITFLQHTAKKIPFLLGKELYKGFSK